ncbi:short chain dehydrogenase [Actinokineospora spheciospongiae]|uniref:short chain dehydrogenase n=1 Tax=Actinokineospora spheciospongiae TaxID=909613 RepID=UPI000D71D09E|nr:short chain dehydrogenase [Actinokineospora spheciospongiae]PWW62770.1 NAD(P)-dependent dehydrogenase (short-subunit alcohol dehydrogenase family) [Actinokineospora spheciospongiae]
MRVVVIGASGTIGAAVVEALEPRHEVVRASRESGVPVDIGDSTSVDRMFDVVGGVDAVVCVAAHARSVALGELTGDHLGEALRGKLIGQAMLVSRSIAHLRDGGSITLTAGDFGRQAPGSAVGVLVNEGLQGFVRAAAPDLPRGLRVNVVSPGWVRETQVALGMAELTGVPARVVARSYVECVEGGFTGRNLFPASNRTPPARGGRR